MENFEMESEKFNFSMPNVVVVTNGPIALADLVILMILFIIGFLLSVKRIYRRLKQLMNADG